MPKCDLLIAPLQKYYSTGYSYCMELSTTAYAGFAISSLPHVLGICFVNRVRGGLVARAVYRKAKSFRENRELAPRTFL